MKWNYGYSVPESKKLRVIINTDAKNEADDQYAIVHALLSPKLMIKGIIAAHFGTHRSDRSMEESYEEIQKLLTLMDIQGQVDVYKGAERALADETTPVNSEGAQLIIREALKDDPSPLFVIFLGPLTDLASAYLLEPKIADKLTAIWIGGGKWPEGGREFNLLNDIHAANVVFESSIPVWQVPINLYRTFKVSIAELEKRVKPCGKIGKYLFEQLVELNQSPRWTLPYGETWVLGDSPAVMLLLDHHDFYYELKPAPRFTQDMYYVHNLKNRPIRVYHYVDQRATFEDMYAKLALNFPPEE